MEKVTKEESDEKYLKELNRLYQLSVNAKPAEIGNAAFLLEKVRNMELYLIRPAEEKNDTAV